MIGDIVDWAWNTFQRGDPNRNRTELGQGVCYTRNTQSEILACLNTWLTINTQYTTRWWFVPKHFFSSFSNFNFTLKIMFEQSDHSQGQIEVRLGWNIREKRWLVTLQRCWCATPKGSTAKGPFGSRLPEGKNFTCNVYVRGWAKQHVGPLYQTVYWRRCNFHENSLEKKLQVLFNQW